MSGVVDPASEFASLTEPWSPRIVGRVNDQYVKVAKLAGELAWHKHDDEDEMFFVIKGDLTIEFEDRASAKLSPGQFCIVPKGVMHNPVATSDCWIMLIEPVSTKHTGDIVIAQTRTIEEQLR